MSYAPIAAALAVALLLGWVADLLTGRRGFGATGLVAVAGAVAGWFLSQRVLAMAGLESWDWVVWSVLGAALALAAFLMFRSKR